MLGYGNRVSIIKGCAREAVSSIGDNVIPIQILQFFAYFSECEAIPIEQSHFLLDLIIQIRDGGCQTDAVIVSPQGHLLAIEAADDAIEDVVFLGDRFLLDWHGGDQLWGYVMGVINGV